MNASSAIRSICELSSNIQYEFQDIFDIIVHDDVSNV